jgi:hypothetical protein
MLKPLAVFTLCGIIFFSCKKSNNSTAGSGSNPDSDSAVSLSTNAAAADNLYNDVYDVLAQTTTSSATLSARTTADGRADGVDSFAACTIVTINPSDVSTYPKTVTLNFGTGCTSWYGVTRSGTITFVFSDHFKNPNATVTATFTNYKVAGYKLEGNYSVTNQSSLTNGVMFTSSVTGGKVTYPDGTTWYSYSGNKTIKQTAGLGSSNYNDYVFSITGSHSYASYTGKTLTDSVTTALVKQVACKNIVSGVVAFTYNGLIKGTLDYGNGTCDSIATINIGALSKTIGLPR